MHTQDFCFNSKVVCSLVLDARRRGAHNYGVSGIVWYGYSPYTHKSDVEHASCHVTMDTFSQRNSKHNQHLATRRMSGIPIASSCRMFLYCRGFSAISAKVW